MIAPPPDALSRLLRRSDRSRDDSELIESCLAGRQGAWDELVERYTRLVYSVPRRCGLGDADAEDVHQTAFLQLYRNLEKLRNSQRLASWLLTTAYRESWRLSRQNRSRLEQELDPALDGPVPDDDEAARFEQQQMVREALRRLGGRCEQLLAALFAAPGDPNYETIARDLGMKVGSIGPTRARCFRKLEAILVEMGFEPETMAETV